MTFSKYIINNEVIFDVNLNELTPLVDSGESVMLNMPTARCLLLLLQSNGQVVSREEFLEKVWNERGIVVSQNTFYQNISLLRKSLAKAGLNSEAIVTIRQRGFILSSDVTVATVSADEYPCSSNAESESINILPYATTSKHLHSTTSAVKKKVSEIPVWLLIVVIIIIVADFILICIKHLF